MNRNSKKWPCLAIALAALSAAGFMTETARAQDASATNAPPKAHWESVASADATLTRGNSRTFLGTISINTARKSASDEILLGGSGGYDETTTKQSNGSELTTETADYLRGFSQWNHLFTDRFYAGIRFEAVHDNIADINYRLTVSPLAGYYFIKHTNTFLSMELGPSYVYEQIGGKTLSYAAVNVMNINSKPGQESGKMRNGIRRWIGSRTGF